MGQGLHAERVAAFGEDAAQLRVAGEAVLHVGDEVRQLVAGVEPLEVRRAVDVVAGVDQPMGVEHHDGVDPQFAAAPADLAVPVDRRLAAAVARAGQLGQVQRGYVGDLGSQSDFAHDDSLVARWAWQQARPLAARPDSSDCVCTPALLAASGGRSARARPTRPSGDVMAAHGYTHVLDLGEYLEAVFPAFASGARGLHPAERLAQVAHVLAVDEDHPGLDAACQAMGLADVLGPDVGGQAVFHVVGQAQRLGFVLERDQADHRAEDLLPGRCACGCPRRRTPWAG